MYGSCQFTLHIRLRVMSVTQTHLRTRDCHLGSTMVQVSDPELVIRVQFYVIRDSQIPADSVPAAEMASVIEKQLYTLNNAFAGVTVSSPNRAVDTRIRFKLNPCPSNSSCLFQVSPVHRRNHVVQSLPSPTRHESIQGICKFWDHSIQWYPYNKRARQI